MKFNAVFTVSSLVLALVAPVIGKPVNIGYYPSWKRAQMANVDFSKYTHINLSFGIPTAEGTFSYEGDWFLAQTVADIHSKGAKVLLSVGGWTGSNYFSNIVKSASTRSTMVTSMVNYVKTNNLDGIDIDWEYPGRLGNTCNIFDTANDTPNFLVFLQELRAAFDSTFGPRQKLITLAVRVEPFDVTGGPSKDIAAFAKVVDYANLMQYDINGGWNAETGPNAPFNFEQGKGAPLSFVTAIDSWTGAGWPAVQLTAGIGYYGRSTTAKVDMTKDPNNQYQPQESVVPLGDSEDAAWYDACAGTTSNSGTWMWKHLRDQGVLSSPSTAAAPWVRQWDPVSQTPWLFNPTTKQFISYDDPQSIKIKVDYAAAKGLGGTMVWSMNMDYNDELLSVVNSFGSQARMVATSSTVST
ncbi:chitinase [Kickxella alabastrina]|uniref:chitinase n=1 Tax=Kickxella alabastrina TaxID=61397 RepID=UPI00221EE28A|nr:chitinase [Kickxella alabastrina]KAI7823436.1 chitinase [Kickxella alabastrina]